MVISPQALAGLLPLLAAVLVRVMKLPTSLRLYAHVPLDVVDVFAAPVRAWHVANS